ncbi:hypothetical protein D2E25_0307 [Bifidobacterium goeldii]|uniref:Glycosyltransferase 2-like domain-containing protein n=1 Tax=Bifidobacterium goeldii TaxID=2306975 RepID=A0A430FMP6_9BIFI|nr:glycosyltransferase family 2 protein [Bifidobacterium goeldii]RSX54001.1 hypothetical protein D2E25_0307 [Bifidobacterium goeldii]
MTSTGTTDDLQQIVADLLASRPYSHRQEVDPTIAAVVTVEDDLRFFPDTMRAVLSQSVLPGVIVVADCTGSIAQPVQSTFEVITAPAGPATFVPEPQTVAVRLVRAKGARSFSHAVSKALQYAEIGPTTRAIWMLHDDSRPACDDCLERLLEAWRNTPTASLLGAKQLDWQGLNLHDVGSYAYHHDIRSLVVDGEPDQEQYDTRRDVFCVSLAGALMPVETLHATKGGDAWFTSFAESRDLGRRICVSGGRVVVVPQARIAHRRARFEGVRTKGGAALEEGRTVNNAMMRMVARQRYAYTDMRLMMWPLVWVASVIISFGRAVAALFAKRPFEACCELCLPWRDLFSLPRAIAARRRLTRCSRVGISRLSALVANRQQVAQWHDRVQALNDQRHVVLLSPLAKAHLHRRAIQRWLLALLMAALCEAAVVATHWTVLRQVFGGGYLYSDVLLPTGGSFAELVRSATTSWVFGGGVSAPPAPGLLVLMGASILTFGHVSAAMALIVFAAAPLAALSFWALAGVFTRSDFVRVACGLLWVSMGAALGLFAQANLPMLTVMVFLPGAFAFVFRAVGMYHTEDQDRSHHSVQAAALAALCFIPVVAAEPQLMLSLIVVFLFFLIAVRSHRAMLLLIPLPAAICIAPTIVNAIHHASEGAWRQLFGDIMLPSHAANGSPAARGFIDLFTQALGVDVHADWLTWLRTGDLPAILLLTVFAVLLVLAIVALLLPFALRASRMMWVVMIAGALLSCVSARVTIAVDSDGAVAGSALPGIVMCLLGGLSGASFVSGIAVRRFRLLRRSSGTAALEGATAAARLAAVRVFAAHVGRTLLVIVLVAGTAACSAWSLSADRASSPHTSYSGLPMVAVDYLERNPNHRILALSAQSPTSVQYTVMRTSRGDLLDSSPAERARIASTGVSATDASIASASARLLANADSEAIAAISSLGFGGIYVASSTDEGTQQAIERLASNITASDGTQSVVSNSAGTYYRLTLTDADAQHIDVTVQQHQQHNPWRYAWLWSMGIIVALYCLVAVPRSRRIIEEDS